VDLEKKKGKEIRRYRSDKNTKNTKKKRKGSKEKRPPPFGDRKKNPKNKKRGN